MGRSEESAKEMVKGEEYKGKKKWQLIKGGKKERNRQEILKEIRKIRYGKDV